MKDKNKIIVFISGAVLGIILFLSFFGIDILDFTYTDWLLPQNVTDLTQHYLGWVEYRASGWHFPIGLIENIQYPNMVSVIYTDSIPIFAIFFKLFSGILPADFQYFGLFGALCYALQGGFAACFIYHFTQKKLFSILSSLFFSGSLIMLFRMYYHTSLSAQWLIIASLYLWICKESELSTVKSILSWAALSTISTLTHLYFLPMIWGCMLCDALDQALHYKYKRGFLSILVSGVCVLLSGWISGLFYGSGSKNGMFYGIFTFNLNGFINPFDYSFFFKQLPTISQWQYEGLAYLGSGMMILIIVCAVLFTVRIIQNKIVKKTADTEQQEPSKNKKEHKKRIKKSIPYIVFCVVFTLLATSNIITFNDHAIYIPIPDGITNALSVFRCSGRLIWPVYYMIFLFTCIGIHHLIKKKYIPELLITTSIIIQIIDISPRILYARENYAPSERYQYESLLTDPAWEECATKYSHIMFYPDVIKLSSRRKLAGYEIQTYACKNHMSLNMVIISRVSTDAVNRDVYAHFERLEQGDSDPDTMYIFLDEIPSNTAGLHYYFANDIIIGTPEPLESAQEINMINQEDFDE